jgi:catechol 2,3-dioxygenase-like lactoylglutathione lyase family enzyme
MRHFAFHTDGESFEQAQDELRRRGVEFSFEDHEITKSIYLFDPDGHRIEITTEAVR